RRAGLSYPRRQDAPPLPALRYACSCRRPPGPGIQHGQSWTNLQSKLRPAPRIQTASSAAGVVSVFGCIANGVSLEWVAMPSAAWLPTKALPLSPEKFRVMRRRARLRQPLFHPDDAGVAADVALRVKRSQGFMRFREVVFLRAAQAKVHFSENGS